MNLVLISLSEMSGLNRDLLFPTGWWSPPHHLSVYCFSSWDSNYNSSSSLPHFQLSGNLDWIKKEQLFGYKHKSASQARAHLLCIWQRRRWCNKSNYNLSWLVSLQRRACQHFTVHNNTTASADMNRQVWGSHTAFSLWMQLLIEDSAAKCYPGCNPGIIICSLFSPLWLPL